MTVTDSPCAWRHQPGSKPLIPPRHHNSANPAPIAAACSSRRPYQTIPARSFPNPSLIPALQTSGSTSGSETHPPTRSPRTPLRTTPQSAQYPPASVPAKGSRSDMPPRRTVPPRTAETAPGSASAHTPSTPGDSSCRLPAVSPLLLQPLKSDPPSRSPYPSARPTSLAKYVTIKSAPARWIASSDSSIARSRSSQPRSNAACSILYSPETW